MLMGLARRRENEVLAQTTNGPITQSVRELPSCPTNEQEHVDAQSGDAVVV
jgi:hypothetical protein